MDVGTVLDFVVSGIVWVSMPVKILFAFFILCFAAAAILVAKRGKRRLYKGREAWAAAHGLTYMSDEDSAMHERFGEFCGEFSMLNVGENRYAFNIMTGTWAGAEDKNDTLVGGRRNPEVCAFDYHYTLGSEQQRAHMTFSAVVVACPMPLKPLFISPEGFFDKFAEHVGAEEIHFESAEFNRAFHVKSSDKRWANALIDQRMMEFLLKMPRFHVEFSGTHIMVLSSQFSLEEFSSAIELACGIVARMPDYLVREQLGQN